MNDDEITHLNFEALTVAIACIGKGEEGTNNDGAWLKSIGGVPGEEWCALFAGMCHRRAYSLVYDGPYQWPAVPASWSWRSQHQLEVGAQALVKAMGRVGSLYTAPKHAIPGDLVAWRRPGVNPWAGHVGMVESVDPNGVIHTIEGNVGAFPSLVHRLVHDVSKEKLFSFATLRK